MIVIFGATGKTGGEAARQLLEAKRQVRAVGRDRKKLQSFVERGAEAEEADLQQSDAVARALEGAESAYVLIPPNFVDPDFRGYQRTVTESLCKAIESSRCRKVVLLSSMGAEHGEGTGPILGLHELEGRLNEVAGLDVLAIRAGYFMENFLSNVSMIQSMGILGAPAPAEAPLTLTASADIGRYAARRLAAKDFRGFEVVNVMGPLPVTFAEATKTIGMAIGKPDLHFVQFGYEDAKQGMIASGFPEQMASLYVEMYRGAAQGLLRPETGTPLEHTSTTFAEFVKQRFEPAFRATAAE